VAGNQAAGGQVPDGQAATGHHSTERGQAATGPRTADRVVKEGSRSTARGKVAIGHRSTARDAKATAPSSTARDPLETGPHSTARDAKATGRRLTVRGVMIGRPRTAQGNQIGHRLIVRAVSSSASLVDQAEILARPRSVSELRDLRFIGRGLTDHDVTPDPLLTAAAAVAGPTRIVRADPAPIVGASGRPATRADRRGQTMHAQRGLRMSIRASSSVKVTSLLPGADRSRRRSPLDARRFDS